METYELNTTVAILLGYRSTTGLEQQLAIVNVPRSECTILGHGEQHRFGSKRRGRGRSGVSSKKGNHPTGADVGHYQVVSSASA